MIGNHWKLLVLCLLLMGSIFTACQREGKDLAAKKPIPGSPKYSVKAEVTRLPGDVHLASVAPLPVATGPNGATLYQTHCIACHQATGTGVPGAFPPLVGSPYVVGDNLDRLASIMLYGLIGPIKVKGAEYNSVMTPFNHLSDEELAAIATHIRSSWGNSAPPVEPGVFAAQRARWGTRGQFQINELGAEE